jgi:hypothetical protein
MSVAARQTAYVPLPEPANDNEDGGEHVLPALRRASRADLMLEGESDEIASITLGRLFRIYQGEPVGTADIWPVIGESYDVDDDDDDNGDPEPANVNSRMRDSKLHPH